MAPLFFLRDDDVWRMNIAFQSFFTMAIDYQIPVVYGVIPGRLQDSCAQKLIRTKKKQPYLLDIVQHGWKHVNYADQEPMKYEFGSRRPYEVQHQDILSGYLKMKKTFGGIFTPIFVPPYHGYDTKTLKAVSAVGFSAFSAGKAESRVNGCFDIPATAGLNLYQDGKTLALTASQMLGRILGVLMPGTVAGAVIHHDAFQEQTQSRELELFFRMLAKLRDKGDIRLTLISQVLKDQR